MKKLDRYIKVINKKFPTATNIHQPHVKGAQNNVLFATLDDGISVFKFGDHALVEKNAIISQLFNIREIHVPHISAYNVDGVYFEKYKRIDGNTLFEEIANGMTEKNIKDVYRDVLKQFHKMSLINPSFVNKNLKSHVEDIALINVTNVNGKVLGKLSQAIVYLMNAGHKNTQGVYHCDITPKNIIVKNNKFAGFVDVDNVCICNKNYAFGVMAAKYQEMGFDAKELLDMYKHISYEEPQTDSILNRLKFIKAGKKILWKNAHKNR